MSVNCLIKCCVPGCNVTNITEKLYKFPTIKFMADSWMRVLKSNFPDMSLTLDKTGRCQRYVCVLHFEKKYIMPNGRRHNLAIPTLFTEKEILTKTPSEPFSLGLERILRNLPKDDESSHCEGSKHSLYGEGTLQDMVVDTESNQTGYYQVLSESPEDDSLQYEGNEKSLYGDRTSEAMAMDTEPDQKEDIYDENKENLEPCPFSWQKTVESVEDHYLNQVSLNMDVIEENNIILHRKHKADADKSKEPNVAVAKSQDKTHREYYCDQCEDEITGYTCVQCENFDLCGACEIKLVHPHHYMLRVPRPRPFEEIRIIIRIIREKLKLLHERGQSLLTEDEIKQEDCETTDTQMQQTNQETEIEAVKSPSNMHTNIEEIDNYEGEYLDEDLSVDDVSIGEDDARKPMNAQAVNSPSNIHTNIEEIDNYEGEYLDEDLSVDDVSIDEDDARKPMNAKAVNSPSNINTNIEEIDNYEGEYLDEDLNENDVSIGVDDAQKPMNAPLERLSDDHINTDNTHQHINYNQTLTRDMYTQTEEDQPNDDDHVLTEDASTNVKETLTDIEVEELDDEYEIRSTSDVLSEQESVPSEEEEWLEEFLLESDCEGDNPPSEEGSRQTTQKTQETEPMAQTVSDEESVKSESSDDVPLAEYTNLDRRKTKTGAKREQCKEDKIMTDAEVEAVINEIWLSGGDVQEGHVEKIGRLLDNFY